jgi:hypothetical protein|tara:strand:+ start:315 stop:488 length:174 start_codon:yes stop_codon:yes gene_type:complete
MDNTTTADTTFDNGEDFFAAAAARFGADHGETAETRDDETWENGEDFFRNARERFNN